MPSPINPAIASNEVLTLFPTLVCRVQLEAVHSDSINHAIASRVNALVDAVNPPENGERLRTGITLHTVGELASLAAFVESNAEGVLSYLMAVHDGIEITACWADLRGPGARMSDETRTNACLSAIYFCSLPEGEARVYFRDPRTQNSILSAASAGAGRDRSGVPVREGTLLLFPAWLARGMDRNPEDAPSISIGFDLMFRNFTESMSKPLWEGNSYKQA